MKQRAFIVLFICILVPLFSASAQNLVLDDYSHSSSQYLNNLIAADSTSAEFLAGTRVYVLRKDGQYRFNATISTYQGKPIVITVDPSDAGYAGTGLKPECYGVLSSSKKLPGNFVQMQNGGRVELHDINVSGYLCGDAGGSDSLIGYQQGALITIGTAGGTGRIIIDGCVLHGVNGNHVRTDGVTDTVIITNTIFGDMGNVAPSNFGAGKAVDLRNVDIVYCKIQNCTFVNAQDRIVRHFQSKNPIHNFIFDHNTVVNCMGYHGFFSLGKVDSTGSGTLQITNNLLIDHFALGADTAYIRQVEFSDPGELDPVNSQPRMVWVMTNRNDAAVWNIKNNYYAITDSGAAVRALKASDGYIPRVDATKEDPFLTWNMNKVLASQGKDTTATFTKIQVSMATVPPLMTSMIRWIYTPRASAMTLTGTYVNPNFNGYGVGVNVPYTLNTSGDGKEKNGGDANYKASLVPGLGGIYALDYNRRSLEWYSYYALESILGVGNVLNCSYKSSVNLLSAGTDSKIIGDTRWQWTGFVPGIMIFTATPKTIDFGAVAKNGTKTDTIVVSSGGSSTLVVDSVKSSAAEFTVSPNNASIEAGSSLKFVVTYHPTTPGAKSGSIVFYNNGQVKKDTVAVSGDVVSAATFEPSKTSIDFGTVNSTSPKTDSVVVTNHGTISLTITAVTSSNAAFTVTPTSASIGIDSLKTFYIKFTPTTTGQETGNIAFTHNALTHDTVTVTGNGILVSVNGLTSMIPEVYALHNNYPNPFNPSTTIQYDLPKQSLVTLKIYSMLGQEVATLVDGIMEAGYQHVIWNGLHNNIASGVYFYRIFAKPTDKGEAFTQVKKMLLLK